MKNRGRAHMAYGQTATGSTIVAHPLRHLRPWARARLIEPMKVKAT